MYREKGYSFNVVYQPGKTNPADCPSHRPVPLHHCTKEVSKISIELEAHVHSVVNSQMPEDKNSQLLVEAFNTGTVCPKESLQLLKNVAQELSVYKGVVLCGSLINFPPALETVLRIAHEIHQSIFKSKLYIRSGLWFPGIDRKHKSVD